MFKLFKQLVDTNNLRKSVKNYFKNLLLYLLLFIALIAFVAVLSLIISFLFVVVKSIDNPNSTFSTSFCLEFKDTFYFFLKTNELIFVILFCLIPKREWFDNE